jgi:multidrug resistance efflux pump
VRKKQLDAARRRVKELTLGGAELVAPAEENYDPAIAGVLAEIEMLASEHAAAERRREELTAKAAVDGIVTKLAVRHEGEVVPPGTRLLELAQIGKEIVFEAFVSNAQVGAVKVGQSALVKLDAFPHAEYGSIEAEVKRVFPDAEMREGQGYGFRVELALKGYTTGEARFTVGLGLSGQAEIVTGKQSMWSYVLLGSRAAISD